MLKRFSALLVFLYSGICLAPPLTKQQTFVAANPATNKIGSWSLMLARGSGTNDMYVVEVDPTTGALPVNIVSGSLVLGYDTNYGAVGADTLRTAAQIGNATGAADFGHGSVSAQTLRSVSVLSNGTAAADFNYGAGGANTLRTTSMLGVGTTAVSNANPVPISDAGGTITVDGNVNATNFPATVSVNSGTVDASTIRVVLPTNQPSVAVSDTVAQGYLSSIDISADSIDTKTVQQALNFGAASGGLRTASQIGNAAGAADFNYGASGAQTIRTASQVGNATGAADFNYGTPGAQTLRTASMIGVGSAAASSSNPVPVSAPGGRSYSDSVQLSYSSTNVTTGAWVELIASSASAINSLTIFSGCGESLELGTGAAASETRKLLIPPGGIDGSTLLAIPAATRISVRAISGTCSSGQFVMTGLL